jgi:hypothetical protein
VLALVFITVGCACSTAAAEGVWSFNVVRAPETDQPVQLQILLHDQVMMTYVFRDPQISRPYFANVHLPGDIQLTRQHPPGADDLQDHPLFHPGLWLAFGDLSSADNWRLKAPVEHVRFVVDPQCDNEKLTYQVENIYWAAERSHELCREVATYTFYAQRDHITLHWQSRFLAGANPLVFGDQEEMGLGVRLHTGLAVSRKLGGRILNAQGNRNEKETWGVPSPWIDYSGPLANQFVGIMLIPSPRNFRPCWYHARDYGFVAANPFGQQAFTRTDQPSRIVVDPGKELPLEFVVLFHWHTSEDQFNPDLLYQSAVKLITR